MEKSNTRPIKTGKGIRMNFSHQKEVLQMPNLIEIQKDSYDWFLGEGLREVFRDIFPIEDFVGHLSLDFVDFRLYRDEAKYSITEYKERDAIYAAPMKVKVRLYDKDKDEHEEHEVFMGDLPLMTDTGSFVINGAERVTVSQLVHSPGIYYAIEHGKVGKEYYFCQVIPNHSAWLEYETDSNDVLSVRVGRTRKVPATVLLRTLGLGSNDDIKNLFGDEPKLEASFPKDSIENHNNGLLELYRKIHLGEPFSVESAEGLLHSMSFDARHYDLARVDRYKFNKKSHLKNRAVGRELLEDAVDPDTGEILAESDMVITGELMTEIQDADILYMMVEGTSTPERALKVLSNLMVDIRNYVDMENPTEYGIVKPVCYPAFMEVLKGAEKNKVDVKKYVKRHVGRLIPKHITKEDIFASINYNMQIEEGIGSIGGIDYLGNRRIRAVGGLLQNRYRIGLSRMERVVRERTTTQDISEITPQSLINIKPITTVVREFFSSSQLSQFTDQNNPLPELTHKRRLSALGPGGLSRDRAGFEIRDVRYTHYGRVYPIETPEGLNIGLINSFASYVCINPYGSIEAPYRVVDKSEDPKNPCVTDDVVYLAADEEDNFIVAQADEPLDEEGRFVHNNVSDRHKEETLTFQKRLIDLMDVSPKTVFSATTSMVPFLRNDDADRALMDSNMQRQAVPLILTDTPVVSTGMEAKAAVDSGVCQAVRHADTVMMSAGGEITMRRDDNGEIEHYKLTGFQRLNQSNSYNRKPIVSAGDHVEEGEVIADGPPTHGDEIGLGKNPLIGFMTWEGYNYEDAVLLSERLVQNDVLTSIHIEEYECASRDTRLGAEEITGDVPGVGDDALRDLDDNGIIHVGAEVRAGDILVGKVMPKDETELTVEERLLHAIFGEKAREVRNTSLKTPRGTYGTIVETRVFTRENGDELSPGMNQSVRIYIAQERKISVDDKMTGRHGNKGVVSHTLPVEDMSFPPNDRPLDIALNPLGVLSRMNIGQVKEIHFSLAVRVLGFNVSSPVFDGADENDIMDTLEMANDYANGSFEDFKTKYGEVLRPEIMQHLEEHLDHREEWRDVPIQRNGKIQLRDGRTGEPFEGETTIGFMHYLKLHHLIDDRVHARSTGPYAMVTQQPLGGKAQFGGQRLGETEVWALETYGVVYALREILTFRSDDVVGRVKTCEAIIKGQNTPQAGVPEPLRVLLRELQALGLDVRVPRENGEEVEPKENVDEENMSMRSILEGDSRRYRDEDNFAGAGYSTQEFQDGELVNVGEEATEDDTQGEA